MLCPGDYTLPQTSLRLCSFVLHRRLPRPFQQCGSLPGCFGQGHPRRADIRVFESPCPPRWLIWALGLAWGLNPGAVCTASAPGAIPLAPVFPPPLLPPVSGAQPVLKGSQMLQPRERSRTEEKEVQRWAVAGHTQASPPTHTRSVPECSSVEHSSSPAMAARGRLELSPNFTASCCMSVTAGDLSSGHERQALVPVWAQCWQPALHRSSG